MANKLAAIDTDVEQGTLRGYDQATNVILSSAEERVFSSTEAVQVEPLGVYLLRGDNVYGKFIDRHLLSY